MTVQTDTYDWPPLPEWPIIDYDWPPLNFDWPVIEYDWGTLNLEWPKPVNFEWAKHNCDG